MPVLIVAIICATVLAIVYRLNPQNDCEKRIVFEKGGGVDCLIKEASKYDVFTIIQSSDGKYEIKASNHDYGEYY